MSKSAELKARKAAAVPDGVGSRGIYVAKAENPSSGTSTAGVSSILRPASRCSTPVIAIPKVMEAVAQQAQAFTHTCFHVSPYESYVRLAERLNALAPGDFAKKTLFLNSGAEAVENAVKIARYYTKRSAVIAFSGGFHGRTLMTMALTGKVMPYKRGFGPFPAEVYHAEFPQPYRGHHHGAGAGRFGPAVSRRRRSEVGRRHHHRTGAGRGRLQCGARRVPARAAPPVR